MHTHHLLLPLALAASPLAPLASADVLVVGPPTMGGTHATIQSAVDAAAEGDAILVAVDSPGFTISGKGLSVLAWPDVDVAVQGTIRVVGLPASSTVLLDGLTVTGAGAFPKSEPALELSSNQGHVRVHSCTLTGGKGMGTSCPQFGEGGDAVRIDASSSVVLQDCLAQGGDAAGMPFLTCNGARGGDGVRLSASVVAVYGGEARGGTGGLSRFAGDGGIGVNVLSWGVFVAGTTVVGGMGGAGDGTGGDGGDAFFLASATQTRLLDVLSFGGQGGPGPVPGASGQPLGGPGNVVQLPGSHAEAGLASVVSSAGRIEVELEAEPDSQVWVFVSSQPALRFVPGWSGFACFPANSHLSKAPTATVPWSGHLVLEVPSPLPSGEAGACWVQVLVRSPGGALVLSAPDAALVLQCDALLPDCNLNGSFDLCDVLSGDSQDCDVSGVPDECESFQTTWHVDAAASAGGNGSSAAPFQTLQQAFTAATSCDTILLADGVYSGPGNRNLSWNGGDLTLRSANGASACVFDLQSQGHLAQFSGDGHVRVEGLTVLASSATAISATEVLGSIEIVDCAFEGCSELFSGGALFLSGQSCRVERCRFTGNSSLSLAGGAIDVGIFFDLAVIDSIFEGNTAFTGGAISMSGTAGSDADVVIARCSFLGNSSSDRGGAIRSGTGYLRLESCLLAGNGAGRGGALAILVNAGPINGSELVGCTFVDNSASTAGGAISIENTSAETFAGLLADSILWGNASPSGSAVDLASSAVHYEVRFSAVEGGQAGVHVQPGATLVWGAGILDLDPLFADADGPDDDPLTLGDNDWRLASSSPCIDAGSDALLPQDLADQDVDTKRSEATPFDLDGGARQQDDPAAPDVGVGSAPIVDMGAFERT